MLTEGKYIFMVTDAAWYCGQLPTLFVTFIRLELTVMSGPHRMCRLYKEFHFSDHGRQGEPLEGTAIKLLSLLGETCTTTEEARGCVDHLPGVMVQAHIVLREGRQHCYLDRPIGRGDPWPYQIGGDANV